MTPLSSSQVITPQVRSEIAAAEEQLATPSCARRLELSLLKAQEATAQLREAGRPESKHLHEPVTM